MPNIGKVSELRQIVKDEKRGDWTVQRQGRNYDNLKKELNKALKNGLKYGQYVDFTLSEFLKILESKGNYTRYAGRRLMLEQTEEKIANWLFLQKRAGDTWHILAVPSKKVFVK